MIANRIASLLLPAALCMSMVASASGQGASGARLDQGDRHLVIMRDLTIREAQLVSISEETIRLRAEEETSAIQEIDRDACIAFLLIDPPKEQDLDAGLALLADGQRLPGSLSSESAEPEPDALIWEHRFLGRVTLPINTLDAILLDSLAELPEPGDGDVIGLQNGDRLEGFIISIGNTLEVEVNDEIITIPIDRVESIRLISTDRDGADVACRVWMINESVIDVADIRLGDDGIFRVMRPHLRSDIVEQQYQMRRIVAAAFQPELIVPLASVDPVDVAGPLFRYEVAEPVELDETAPLGLSRLGISGPIVVRYPIPEDVTGFAMEITLPERAHDWGDYDFVVSDDDREVFRARLNRDSPSAVCRVPLRGSELTLTISEGQGGPVLDEAVLSRAFFLKGADTP